MNWKSEIIGLPLKVLILEDSIPDFELIQEQLALAGYVLDTTHVINQKEFISSLDKNHFYDIIISDFNLPSFDAFEALQLTKKLRPDIPFICISGSIGEETAIELLKLGAVDYVLKDRPDRLPYSVKRALDEANEKIALQKIETSLRLSEEKFRTIFENVQDVFYQTDLTGIIKELSPSIKNFSDFDTAELIGKPVYDLYCNPEDRKKLLQILDHKGEVRDYEIKMKTKQNEVKYASINARLILNSEGIPDHIDGSLRDITPRKIAEESLQQSEQRLKDILFSTADWVWEIDTNGKYTYSSQKSIDFFEVSEEEIIGKTPFDFMPKEEANRVAPILAEIIAKKEPIRDLENWNIGKDGKLICLLTNGLPFFNHKGELKGYRGIDKNITERKLFEQELIKAKEKAEESDRLKSAFLANMSHEIRTPMNGILGFAGLLKEPELSGEQQKKYIQIIEKSGDRMLNIINDIVSISKIESGIMDIQLSETNINNQFQFVFDSLKLDADTKNLNLSFICGLADKEAIIKTDGEKFYRILTNLVKNAIKYTNNGKIEFGYHYRETLFEFYVKDTGIGIPKTRLNAIFERFIQVDVVDKMARQGAGLGLSISKAYVEMLGGKIWVESKENIGSTFYFTLPCIHENTKKNKNLDAIKLDHNLVKDLKILIVDDDEISNQLLKIYMNDFANEIITVITGNDAIETCKINNDIDLVLMDIQMPDINGYEATRKIRLNNKDVIIIAQTAFALESDREKSIAAGCNDYISKPIKKEDLELIIQKNFKNYKKIITK